MGHGGDHSWLKHKRNFVITAGAFSRPDPERGFIDAVIYSPNAEKLRHPIIVSSTGQTKKKE